MPPPHSVALERNSNLRDLGGWPGAGGRAVRRGLLFRGPALTGLSENDRRMVGALGLRTVIDLRGVRERAAAPVEIEGTRIISLPIEPRVGAGLADILRTGRATHTVTPAELHRLLRNAYVAYAGACVSQYRALFAALLEEGAAPVLIHCSAGKDRTGFAAALILSALGVAAEDVRRDYLATNTLWRRETARFPELDPSLADALLRADEALLAATFSAAEGRWGSLEAYMEGALGLDPVRRAALHCGYLEPEP